MIKYLDILGRPVSVGQKIMVKGYYSMSLDKFATVTKINPKSITVEFYTKVWEVKPEYGWDNRTNKYSLLKPGKSKLELISMTRQPEECLLVPDDFADQAKETSKAYLDDFLNIEPATLLPKKRFTQYKFEKAIESLNYKKYSYKRHYPDHEKAIDQKIKELENFLRQEYPEYAI